MTCTERRLLMLLFTALAAAALALDARARGYGWAAADAEVALLAYLAVGFRGRPRPLRALAALLGGLLLGVVLSYSAAAATVVLSVVADARSALRGAPSVGLLPPVAGLAVPVFIVGCAALSGCRATHGAFAVAAAALVLAWPFAVVHAYGLDPRALLAGTVALPCAAAVLGRLSRQPTP